MALIWCWNMISSLLLSILANPPLNGLSVAASLAFHSAFKPAFFHLLPPNTPSTTPNLTFIFRLFLFVHLCWRHTYIHTHKYSPTHTNMRSHIAAAAYRSPDVPADIRIWNAHSILSLSHSSVIATYMIMSLYLYLFQTNSLIALPSDVCLLIVIMTGN